MNNLLSKLTKSDEEINVHKILFCSLVLSTIMKKNVVLEPDKKISYLKLKNFL